ncbi:MAG: hypothetical protein PF487_11840 [Bacteroidales bacterium]|jgi:hypothetical protein|nr:hypothetical protein [Bacteroidales bacterium]
MDTEIEGLKLKGITIKDLLLPEFIKRLEDKKINIEAVSLVFIREEADGNKGITPFIFNHQNSTEVKEKILHISGANESDLKKVSEIVKEVKNK